MNSGQKEGIFYSLAWEHLVDFDHFSPPHVLYLITHCCTERFCSQKPDELFATAIAEPAFPIRYTCSGKACIKQYYTYR